MLVLESHAVTTMLCHLFRRSLAHHPGEGLEITDLAIKSSTREIGSSAHIEVVRIVVVFLDCSLVVDHALMDCSHRLCHQPGLPQHSRRLPPVADLRSQSRRTLAL